MNRQEVYKIIDGEREYQDNLSKEKGWNDKDRNPAKSVGDFLTLIHYYFRKAERGYANYPGDKMAMNEIRKIAAIAVHCMEEHETPPRQ